MVTFLALYRGRTLGEAELVGVTTDSELVAHVAAELLQARDGETGHDDPALAAISGGKRQALEFVRHEADAVHPQSGSRG